MINWGILGCGDVTEIKSGPAFNKVGNSRVEAVMRRNASKAEDYAKRHAVDKWYSKADDLINDGNVNAIYIATPPAPHKDYALQALKAGKNVYIEKPVTLNSVECKELIEAEKRYGKKVVVAHYRRAQPFFLKLKELIDQEVIGDIRLVDLKLYQQPGSEAIAKTEENWRINPEISGGGLFFDLAPHQLDILVHIFGKPLAFNGFSVNQRNTEPVADVTLGQILFAKDVAFTGTWCFNSLPEDEVERCEIIGSKGKISFSFFSANMSLTANGKTIHFDFPPMQHVQQAMIAKTVDYFAGVNGENPCSLQDALVSMEVMENFMTVKV
ncbi:Gfo/Idh/MocA family protein [Pelobium manganitolerans]|uniref:Gfo/Idh/MocA family protein n=1 Tax=Pelobium manganitolerans TaxID=1842495 RepID=UPI003FA3CD31